MSKRAAFGTTLTRTSPTGGSGLIGQVQSFDGPDLSLDTEDVTSHDSPGGWEEVVPTVLRTGELSMKVVYDAGMASQSLSGSGLMYQMVNKILGNYSLAFNSGASSTTTWSFSAYVTGHKMSNEFDGAVTADVKMKISGSPTLA
jgi:hypothetical protein